MISVYVGIDPGPTTGIVVVQKTSDSFTILSTRHGTDYPDIWRAFSKGREYAVRAAWTEAGLGMLYFAPSEALEFEVVGVVENFVGSGPRNADITTSIKLCGAAESECRRLSFQLALRSPGSQRAFESAAERLLTQQSCLCSRHTMSALGHILGYLYEIGEYPWQR